MDHDGSMNSRDYRNLAETITISTVASLHFRTKQMHGKRFKKFSKATTVQVKSNSFPKVVVLLNSTNRAEGSIQRHNSINGVQGAHLYNYNKHFDIITMEVSCLGLKMKSIRQAGDFSYHIYLLCTSKPKRDNFAPMLKTIHFV